MDRPRSLSAANRHRRIGPAGAALLLVLLGGACAAPSLPPPPPESQPQPRSAAEGETAASEFLIPSADERAETLAALPTDESTAGSLLRKTTAQPRHPRRQYAPPRWASCCRSPAATLRKARPCSTAAQLALFDTADERFLLLPRDTGGTASGAERAALALLEEGVDLILGPLFAEGVNAVASHARAHGITVCRLFHRSNGGARGRLSARPYTTHSDQADLRPRGDEGASTDRPVGARDTLWRDGGGRSLDGGSAQRIVARESPKLCAGCVGRSRCRCAASPNTTGAPGH